MAPPAGPPGRLRDFDVVTIPVKTGFNGDAHGRDPFGEYRVKLIGAGRGHTRIATDPPCDAALRSFRGSVTASSPPVTSPLCFVVPPGFQPRYLIIDTDTGPETDETKHEDDVAVSVGTG